MLRDSGHDGSGTYRVLFTPRPAAPDGRSAPPQARGLTAALAAAHADLSQSGGDAAFSLAWQRLHEHRIEVLVGGTPRFPLTQTPDAAGGSMSIGYPPGSLGEPVDPNDVARQWSTLPVWVGCALVENPRTPGDARRDDAHPGGEFEDCAEHLAAAWVWLVIAEPVDLAVTEDELARLRLRLPRSRARPDSEPDRVATLIDEFRYRDLLGSRGTGLWRVRVLVGGPDIVAARRAAAMLCAAVDFPGQPFALAPADDAAGQGFLGSSPLLAAIARPPVREIPGVRVAERPLFDLVPDHPGSGTPTVPVGAILDTFDRPVDRFDAGLDTLVRHTLVVGATGSGKSHTIRHILRGLSALGVPWLVIEPAKAEYAQLHSPPARPVSVIRLGDPEQVPLGLNPLEPEPGFAIQTHIDLVRALFLAAFEAVEPFPQVVAHALTNCYHDLGWDTVVGESRLPGATPRFPTLADLQTAAAAVVDTIGYGREITDNVRGFIDVRLGSLRLGTPGRFLEPRYRIDVATLLSRDTVLEIQDVGDDTDKAFLIGVVLIRLYEHLRTRRGEDDGALAHILVVEEAHRLLRRVDGGPAAQAIELFAAMLSEIRAYGNGFVVAEQIPSKIHHDVVKNTALKIVHRLPAADDRDLVGATINLAPAQSRHVVSLPPGRAIVFADGMDNPLHIAVPAGDTEPAAAGGDVRAAGPARLTLRQLRRAHRIGEDPHLTLWIELHLIAHLVGRPTPRPDPSWLATLASTHPAELLDEAITGLIDAGIGDRYPRLIRYYQPETLAAHLRATALAGLGGRPAQGCDGSETFWQAGRFRWTDVEQALHEPTVPADLPHPDTARWRARGLNLPGSTLLEQRAALDRHPDTWQPDPTTITGTRRPHLLDATIARLTRADTPHRRLTDAARDHLHLATAWPVALLTPSDAENGGRP